MKKLKKVFAVLLSVAMILGMSTTVFADEAAGDEQTTLPSTIAKQYPSVGDEAMVGVSGLKNGDTAKFYRIVEPNYEGKSLRGYKAVEFSTATGGTVKVDSLDKPSAASITAIANAITSAIVPVDTVVADNEGNANSKMMGVGTYIVLVTPSASNTDTVYNPMIVSSYYVVGGIKQEVVNAGTNFQLEGQQAAYAKTSKITIDKNILNPSSGNNKGDDTAIGDKVHFEVKSHIPAYSKAYKTAEFNILDQVSEGLTLLANTADTPIVVTVGDAVATADRDYEVTIDAEKGTMKIAFKSDFILGKEAIGETAAIEAHTDKDVVVTYFAELNGKAGINFDKNTNTVKAEYTNNPTTNDKGTTVEKKTYHYTFGIDAELNGKENETWNKITTELYKTSKKTTTESGSSEKLYPLDGAKFELTNTTTGKKYEATSGKVRNIDPTTGKFKETLEDRAGALQFLGLDAGDYTLKEIEAPSGYSVVDTEVPVNISATYDVDGLLTGYTITVNGDKTEENGKKISTYTATYNADKTNITNIETTVDHGDVIEGVDNNSNTYAFINTDLASLPSTGGIGTIIFTVGGCLIMVVAAALYFANRRRSANSESK